MKKGDKVKPKQAFSYLGIDRRSVGVVVSQHKYKIPDGQGWDVEVRFNNRHGNRRGTVILQGDELIVIKKGRK